MSDLTHLSFDDLLERVAARTPAPGGGAVAAAAGALAAAMGRMVAAYSTGQKTPDDARARVQHAADALRRADHMLRELMVEDAAAYEALSSADKALRAAQRAPEHADPLASSMRAHEAALSVALSVPTGMAAILAEVLDVLDGVKETASRYLLSDLAVAAVLADGAARAARHMILVNAALLPEAPARAAVLRNAASILARCERHCRSIEGFVEGSYAAGP